MSESDTLSLKTQPSRIEWLPLRQSPCFVQSLYINVASMKMAVFWDIAPCRLLEVYVRFGSVYCLHHQYHE
jgi:hypothetical protein